MKLCLFKLLLLSLSISSAEAALVWTGAVNTDIFNDANWDFSGAVNGTTAVDPGVAINEDLMATMATITGTGGNLTLADGATFTLTNSMLTFTGGTTGFAGVDDGVGVARVNAPGVLSLVGSSAAMQFVTVGMDVLVDGTSSLQFYGAGDPINSQTEQTRILISTGGRLTMASNPEFNEQGTEIFVNGIPYDTNGAAAGGEDDSLWDAVALTRTAVPEPSSALLGATALLVLFRRRRCR